MLGLTAPPAARATLFGFNDGQVQDGVSDAREAQILSDVGAQVHRFTFNWRFAEPTPGHYFFDPYDSVYAADLARGVRPVFILMYAPDWTWDKGRLCPPEQACAFPPSNRHLAAWRSIVRRLVTRYPQMAALEVWNEPNLSAFWAPFPQPKRYARLVRAATRTVHAARSPIPVLGGSLSNARSVVPSIEGIDAARYYRTMRKARPAYDGLSLHPYPRGFDFAPTYKMLTEIGTLRRRYRDQAPLWLTEVGTTTTTQVTDAGQAAVLTRLLPQLSTRPDVAAVLVHTLMEPAAGFGPESGYGVVRGTGLPKPAYCALATLQLRSPSSCALAALRAPADPNQERRWDAQLALQGAVEAAATYARRHKGRLDGFRIAGDAPSPDEMPGNGADPGRVGVFSFGSGSKRSTLLCAASRVDTSYCAMFALGRWTYGHAAGPIGAAADATIRGISRGW